MVNVLFLINDLGNGGAERVLVNLVNNFDHSKYRVTLRTLVNAGENKEFLNEQVKYEYIFKKGFRGLGLLHMLPKKYIYNKIAYGNFDIIIVYLHGVLTKIVSCAPEHQKTIAYLHADMEKSPFIKSFPNKQEVQRCFSSYDAIVGVSQQVKESFEKVTGIYKNVYVKYNTFNVEHIKRASLEVVNNQLILDGVLNICTVGKLEHVKGYDRLLRVVKRLTLDNLQFKLTIVGEGPLKKEFETYIKENNLGNYVTLIGYDKNPYKYIGKSDLFVCSSYTEGFSSVVVESIILGVPVVTTNCAGMKEISR